MSDIMQTAQECYKKLQLERQYLQYIEHLCAAQLFREFIGGFGVHEGQFCEITTSDGKKDIGVFKLTSPYDSQWLEYVSGYITYLEVYTDNYYTTLLQIYSFPELNASYTNELRCFNSNGSYIVSVRSLSPSELELSIEDAAMRRAELLENEKQERVVQAVQFQEKLHTYLQSQETVPIAVRESKVRNSIVQRQQEQKQTELQARVLREKAEAPDRERDAKLFTELSTNIELYICSLGCDISVVKRKSYTLYKRGEFPFLHVLPTKRSAGNNKLLIYPAIWLNPVLVEADFIRDVTGITTVGKGNVEITLSNLHDLERVKPLLMRAYADNAQCLI